MSIFPHVFKSYDIRGLAPEEIHPEFAYRLARVLVDLYHPKRIVVGRDMREHSPELVRALLIGLEEGGTEATDIGQCSTPVFYFAVSESPDRYDLGIMVTASHNPHPYNGFKFCKSGCLPIGSGSGMEEIRDRVLTCEYSFDSSRNSSAQQDEKIIQRYVRSIRARVDLPSELPPIRLSVDAGNGMAGIVLPKLFSLLPTIEAIPLFWELDGRFPHHEANPLKTETLRDLQKSVQENSCLFGVAFDGDADRIGIVDEQGTQIPGDILTALLARELLRSHPGSKILYDLRSSWSTSEVIQASGGEAKMCRVGYAHIKRQMREEGALFAGELSLHYYFSDFANCESGDYVLLLLLKILLQERIPLSTIWKSLASYAHSGEINFTVASPTRVIERAHEEYGPQASSISRLDGLRLEMKKAENPNGDWWFNLRASNTEPLLRLNLEARTVEEMERHRQELSKKITQWAQE